MKTETLVIVILAIAVVGGGVWYLSTQDRQPAQLTPEQMLASGVGNLIGGIAGLATQ